MKFIVDLWLDGYDTQEEMRVACIEYINDMLDSAASSVHVELYEDNESTTKSPDDQFSHWRYDE